MTKNLKLICYAIWGGFPITLIIFLFVGLSDSTIQFSEKVENLHMILFTIGIISTGLSVFISSKLYASSNICKNKILISILTKTGKSQFNDANFSLYFFLYTTSLAFAETCSLFGLVSFVITGNIYFFGIMTILAVIGWVMAFPKLPKLEKIFLTP